MPTTNDQAPYQSIRDTVLNTLAWTRLLDAAQAVSGNTCTVLIYHSVASGEANPYIDPKTFISHVEMLSAEFHVLNAAQYLWYLKRGKKSPARSVLITVDDGLENNYSVIGPIMEKRKIPWVVFTPTQALNGGDRRLWFPMLRGICLFAPVTAITLLGRSWTLGDQEQRARVYKEMSDWFSKFPAAESRAAIKDLINKYEAEIPADYVNSFCTLMTAQQLRQLSASGFVEIGCHTKTHPFLPRVSENELRIEIDESAQELSAALKFPCRMFAYPSGSYGPREVERLADVGFECAFAVDKVIGKISRYEIPRTGVYSRALSVLRGKSLGLSHFLRLAGVRIG